MYRCPSCRIVGDFAAEDGLESWKKTQMKNPHGNQRYRTGDGKVQRVQVRGLIHCNQCHVQWPRDFSASVNIGWVFVHAISTGSADRPSYLRSWWDDLKKKKNTKHHSSVTWRQSAMAAMRLCLLGFKGLVLLKKHWFSVTCEKHWFSVTCVAKCTRMLY